MSYAPPEDDQEFLTRILREVQMQAQESGEPQVTLDVADVLRLVKLYAGLPPNALRIS